MHSCTQSLADSTRSKPPTVSTRVVRRHSSQRKKDSCVTRPARAHRLRRHTLRYKRLSPPRGQGRGRCPTRPVTRPVPPPQAPSPGRGQVSVVPNEESYLKLGRQRPAADDRTPQPPVFYLTRHLLPPRSKRLRYCPPPQPPGPLPGYHAVREASRETSSRPGAPTAPRGHSHRPARPRRTATPQPTARQGRPAASRPR